MQVQRNFILILLDIRVLDILRTFSIKFSNLLYQNVIKRLRRSRGHQPNEIAERYASQKLVDQEKKQVFTCI